MVSPGGEEGMDADLRFFGIITASVSHELNNINSTIEQIAGLLEDNLAAAAAGKPFDLERVRDIQIRIARQTGRAAETIADLNRFAHTTDEARGRFELKGLLANLVALCGRLAGLQRIELACEFPAEDRWITGQPFLLQKTVFHCLRRMWLDMPAGEVLTLSLESDSDEMRIVICGLANTPPAAAAVQDRLLTEMASTLPGTLQWAVREGRPAMVIGLPAAAAS